MSESVQLKQEALERLDKLSPPRLRQVVDFMDFLLERPKSWSQEGQLPQGSVHDLLAVAGTWEFEPGELDQILRDIEQSRLMELESDDDLSA